MICPSTHQLLRSSGGYSGPDTSFDKSASLERLFSLARASLAGVLMVDARVEDSSNEANSQRMMCSCQEEVLMLDSDVRVEDYNQIGLYEGGVLMLWKKKRVFMFEDVLVLIVKLG
ncbi:hypothetical protein Tco_1355068 [Tanacetum coccineum]